MDRKSVSLHEPMTHAEFQREMSLLSVPEHAPEPHTWPRHLYEIHKHARNNPDLLMWSTLHATMVVTEAPFTKAEYGYLKGDWQRWRPAIAEDDFGAVPRLSFDGRTSGNLVHQAYHLKLWEDTIGLRVEDLDRICEFGGGYGAMCKIIRRLGFEGEYVIYDLPELSLIQRYYLSNLDILFTPSVNPKGAEISPLPRGDLLIGCYSLTEAPLKVSAQFLEHNFPHYLIAHQDQYHKKSLWDWGDAFMENQNSKSWRVMENKLLPGHRYLFS